VITWLAGGEGLGLGQRGVDGETETDTDTHCVGATAQLLRSAVAVRSSQPSHPSPRQASTSACWVIRSRQPPAVEMPAHVRTNRQMPSLPPWRVGPALLSLDHGGVSRRCAGH
jgi:hypothetical protein